MQKITNSLNLGDKEEIQTATILVMMARLGLHTMTFDEEELLAAMDRVNAGSDDFTVEYWVNPEDKNVTLKLV